MATSGVDDAGGLVARSRQRLAIEHLGSDAQTELRVERVDERSPHRLLVAGVPVTDLDTDGQRLVAGCLGRAYDDVLDAALADLRDLAEGAFDVEQHERPALRRDQVLEPTAPPTAR